MDRMIKYMILYNPSSNNFSVYDGINEVTDLPIVGVRKITSENIVLKYNELGVYNNTLAIGDGINSFKNLSHYNNLSDITTLLNTKVNITDIVDDLKSNNINKPLSANQGKVLKELIDNKVDKVIGKGLSSNDFTDTLLTKLNNISESADSISVTQTVTEGIKSADISINGTVIGLYYTDTTYNEATSSVSGLMSASDKLKLNSIDDGANDYSHPTFTAYIGNPTNNQTPDFGDTFTISQLTSNTEGHITSLTDRTITIPNTLASSTVNGLMSSTDKSKLDNIENNANAYTLPAASTNVLGGVKIGSNISIGNDNEIYLSNANVLAALNKSTDTTKYLRNDGTWQVPPDNNTTYEIVTTETAGLMSASDKSKLDTIDFNANNTTVDSAISETSINPVQNKIIKSYVDTSISNLVNSAPETLDTLYELSEALDNDPNFATTMTTELGKKVDKVTGKGLSANDFTDTLLTKLNNIAENANNYTHPTQSVITGVPTTNQTPTFGGTFTVSQPTVNTLGHVTTLTSRTITIPNTTASSDTLGLVKIGSNINISNGVISVNTGSTSQAGILQLTNSTSSTSTTTAATPNSVKQAYDLAGTEFIGATSSTDGTKGIVPAPSKGDQNKFLKADNTWDIPYTHPTYTATTGVESSNQSVTLGTAFNISQIASDASGHISSQTTRTVTITHPTYTATTGSETDNQTPTFGGTFNISQVTSNSTGHISSQTTRTVKIPDTKGSTDTFGLLKVGSNLTVSSGVISLTNANTLAALNSGSDTSKYLNNAGSWTVPYTHPSYTAYTGKPTTTLTPEFGDTITISQITSDTLGHVNSVTDRNITIPNTTATSDTLGLVQIGSNINNDSGIISVNNSSTTQSGVVQLYDALDSTSTTNALTANQGKVLKDTLEELEDNIQEVLSLSSKSFTILDATKIGASDVVDNLTSDITNLPLSANQGKVLKAYYDDVIAPIDDLTSTSITQPLSANMGRALMRLIDMIYLALTRLDTTKLGASDVVNNVTSTSTVAPLSAYQGKLLADRITALGG